MKFTIPAEPSPRFVGIVAIILAIVCCGYNTARYEMTDTAYFGGDIWYYQSIAVNLVSGEGYRFGGLRDFSDYKFDSVRDGQEQEGYDLLKEQFLSIDRSDFYGSPGYPLFLAGVYRIVGVHPIAVKYLNIALISVAAALIPLISYGAWRRHGLTTGTIAGLLFVFLFAPAPDKLLGESLIMPLLAAWGVILTYCRSGFPTSRVLALGVLSAVAILVKSYVLLVFLTAAFIAAKRRPWRIGIASAVLYVAVVGGMILPWSVFATRHSDRVVVISTQLDNLIMDGNNEDALESGGWSPHWRKKNKGDPKYLYTRLADSDLSGVEKVGRFYRENWTQLPGFFVRKIHSATGRRGHVIVILLLFAAYHVVVLRRNLVLKRAGRRGDAHMPAFPLFCFAVWITNTLVSFGLLRYTLIFLPFMLITVSYAPLEFWRIRRERRNAAVLKS